MPIRISPGFLLLLLQSFLLGTLTRGLVQEAPMTQLGLRQTYRMASTVLNASTPKFLCPCPDDDDVGQNNDNEETSLEDRREAVFAMIGSLWASTGVVALLPDSAAAVYGTDAKMSFPDPIQGMSDRAGKQCLVESLGNRECLVYQEDEEKLLYKGADVKILLDRIQIAAQALDRDIPPLVESKKWTQLTGVLTGPMGQLSSTMSLLEKLAENPSLAKQNAQKVKQDVFAIGTAVTNKQGDAVLKYRQLALQDLAVFLKAL